MNKANVEPLTVQEVDSPTTSIPNQDPAMALTDTPPSLEEQTTPSESSGEVVEQKAVVVEREQKPSRLLALDALRGLTILLMLLVNNVALDTATPEQLQHAPWNGGVHLADFVFPWFLFCIGVAIPFSAASFRKKGLPEWRYDLRVLSRTVVLVLLGCLIDSSILRRPVFTLGVLQIIGLAYLVSALLYNLSPFRRALIAGFLLVGYWAAIKFLPVPGIGVGVFEENKNLILHLNRTYLEAVHLRGLPSVVPTAALVLIGTLLGDQLRRREANHVWKTGWLLTAGTVLVVGGALWNLSLAYNKIFWTPSYILFFSRRAPAHYCWAYSIYSLMPTVGVRGPTHCLFSVPTRLWLTSCLSWSKC